MKRVFNLLVVDESGSMSCIYKQALAGMNETITTIRTMQEIKPEIEQRITLITFDSEHKKLFFDNVAAKDARALTARDYKPCAATPLYDAIGMGIARINAQCGEKDHVMVTIITDGYENASMEYSLSQIRNLIEKLKKQNWTFSFIGTDDLDVEGVADAMGIDERMAFARDEEGTRQMFRRQERANVRLMKSISGGKLMKKGEFYVEEEYIDPEEDGASYAKRILGGRDKK